MYCPNCGSYNEDTYNNCVGCGTYIKDINKNLQKKSAEDKTSEYNTVSIENNITENENTDYIKTDECTETERPVISEEQNVDSVRVYDDENLKRKIPDTQYYQSYYKKKNPDKIKDYFLFSIICTVFGSIGFGIASIVFSVMTKAEILSGNTRKAKIYSANTKFLCILSLIIGIIKFLFIILLISGFSTSLRYFNSYNPFFMPMW